MGKKLGIAALTIGVFLTALAALSRFYMYERLAVAPYDQSTTSISETAPGDEGEYLDVAAGPAVVEGPLRSVRVTTGDPDLSEEASDELGRDVAVWTSYTCTDTPEFDCSSGETPLSSTYDIVAFDRHTGETVSWDGTRSETGGVTVRGAFSGLYFKFPFDTQRQDYEFWDGSLKEAVTAEYQGEEEIDGLTVYKFVQTIEPTRIGESAVPGELVDDPRPTVVADRIYSNVRTLFVEPVTGAIIRGGEQQDSYLEVDGERTVTTTEAKLGYTDDYVADNVDEFSTTARLLSAVHTTFPLIGGILGLVLIAVGVVAVARADRRRA